MARVSLLARYPKSTVNTCARARGLRRGQAADSRVEKMESSVTPFIGKQVKLNEAPEGKCAKQLPEIGGFFR